MTDINTLSERIDAEFSAVEQKVKKFRTQQVEEYKGRQKRLQQLAGVFGEMQAIWRPRLETLIQKFGDRVKVTPRFVPSTREATFNFQSRLAKVQLRFSASTDIDVRKLVLSCDLEIIPVLMRFEPHAEIEFPLDAVDKAAVSRWVEDRIVDFVRTYLSLEQNDMYLKDAMVEDPVAHVRFPNVAAAATLDWKGQKFYFIGEETRQEFARQNQIPLA